MNLNNEVYKELEETLIFLQNWDEISKTGNTKDISLLAGLTGTVLVLIDSYDVFPDLVSEHIIRDYLKKIDNILYDAEFVFPGYCSGLAGLGFFLLKLKQNKVFYASRYDEILKEIDEVLLDQISVDINEKNFDVLHGALGIGLYFLERGNTNQIKKIFDALDENAIKKSGQVYWHRTGTHSTNGANYDFGLAHGNVSYLYFFAKCKSYGFKHLQLDFFIEGSINFYIENEQELSNNIFCYYPSTLLKETFDFSLHQPKNSRLAWCYGDLGIYHTLYITARLLKDRELIDYTLNKLLVVSSRTKETEADKIEGDFCHGSAGISFIFKNLHNFTGHRTFDEASKFWVRETLNEKNRVLNEKVPSHGYNFPIYDNTAQNNSLLEGLSGLTASYLKFLTENKSLLLDEVFLLSFSEQTWNK